jgi:hypothetical protein
MMVLYTNRHNTKSVTIHYPQSHKNVLQYTIPSHKPNNKHVYRMFLYTLFERFIPLTFRYQIRGWRWTYSFVWRLEFLCSGQYVRFQFIINKVLSYSYNCETNLVPTEVSCALSSLDLSWCSIKIVLRDITTGTMQKFSIKTNNKIQFCNSSYINLPYRNADSK